ncbi:PepSY domain-containing protein [Thalassomonas viridans]|uniref:PepSY domain-containing protein n=1 Tax=Thalassomonas viridans TaxID=137584 RepID=A0AAE9Z2V3_9GAMM|nr:PepSY-associated TM helix domain-containing protein [Thalassomonas viridans]WDE05049.1 PepSY domain-containing protein [Thalassomonas viridans]
MRKALHKWHSYGALIAMLPLFIISVTGSILVFKVELDSWLMPEKMLVAENSPARRLPLDTLMAEVKKQYPGHEIGSWEIFNDHSRTDTAYIIEHGSNLWFKVYLNQYTGDLLSAPVGVSDDLTDWLLDLHYKLLLGGQGAFVGAVVAVIFLFLGISGIILYRNFWRHFFTLRYQKALRIFFSDLHKMLGIASSPVLLILAFTGGYWNIAEVVHEVEHVIEEPHPIQGPLYNTSLSIQGLHDSNRQYIGDFTATYLLMPYEPELDITFYGKVDSPNPLNSNYASTITYDKNTGAMLAALDVRKAGNGHVVLDSFRKLHFGHFAGLTSKLIWCLLGLSPVLLAVTGLYLFAFRKRKKKPVSAPVAVKAGI